MSEGIRVGVSACLVGAKVRFDGGHKNDSHVRQLAQFAELITVCPEVELGLGTPRESLRLVRRGPDVSLVAPRSQRDLTSEMQRYAEAKADQVAGWGLSGF